MPFLMAGICILTGVSGERHLPEKFGDKSAKDTQTQKANKYLCNLIPREQGLMSAQTTCTISNDDEGTAVFGERPSFSTSSYLAGGIRSDDNDISPYCLLYTVKFSASDSIGLSRLG